MHSHFKINNLYISSNIIRVVNSERMRWEVIINCNRKPEGRDHFEDTGADGRPIYNWILKT
jgi:hypothetical protein